jgi:hypothetical protein
VLIAAAAEKISECAGACAIIENAERARPRKQLNKRLINGLWAILEIFRIDQVIPVVVNVTAKVVLGEVIECDGEEETAVRTAVIVDRNAARAEVVRRSTCAIAIKVDDAEEKCRVPAAFAGGLTGRDRREISGHGVSATNDG